MTELTPRELLDNAANAGRRRALIVTALPLEMEAVLAHLADGDSTRGDAGAVYEAGLFHDADEEWLIVVCVTGAGTHPAEMAAIEAHYDFDGFDVQMVVGVAGSRKPTAPIGSVIAADQVYNPYSGKASEGTWSVRPRAIQANYRLVELARAVCRKKRWRDRIGGRPELKGPPLEPEATGTVPIAQVAPIVSTEAVLDDRHSDLEELIASSCSDAHAVEMEGYGAQFVAHRKETPGIVVRGISDTPFLTTPTSGSNRNTTLRCRNRRSSPGFAPLPKGLLRQTRRSGSNGSRRLGHAMRRPSSGSSPTASPSRPSGTRHPP